MLPKDNLAVMMQAFYPLRLGDILGLLGETVVHHRRREAIVFAAVKAQLGSGWRLVVLALGCTPWVCATEVNHRP